MKAMNGAAYFSSVEFHADVEDVVAFGEVMEADRRFFWGEEN